MILTSVSYQENLLLIDPDFARDYPPESEVAYQAPAGWRVLYVQGETCFELICAVSCSYH